MKTWPDNFVDTIITDPPYGLDFMGKNWDGDVPGVHFWMEMLRICKPGATLLSFGGTRTWHHLATAIEKAGWQIRDCIMWLYGSGFPKSHNLHDKYEGWGTALKPAWEPIIVAMKPIDGTFAENAEKWGVAGLNVDGGRIASYAESFADRRPEKIQQNAYGKYGTSDYDGSKGRWPANLILDEEAAAMLDGMSEGKIHSAGTSRPDKPGGTYDGTTGIGFKGMGVGHCGFRVGDSGGASRFFYVAKSSSAERNEGCNEMETINVNDGRKTFIDNPFQRGDTLRTNTHPTVKPLSLMKYLCNLTKTPTGGIVLDPFCGSGTTLWAAECHNRPWIGIEQNSEYIKISEARMIKERAQIKFL